MSKFDKEGLGLPVQGSVRFNGRIYNSAGGLICECRSIRYKDFVVESMNTYHPSREIIGELVDLMQAFTDNGVMFPSRVIGRVNRLNEEAKAFLEVEDGEG